MIHKILHNNILVEINSLGAELIQISKDNINYIWNVDETFWNKTSPILFPIVGRLKNDSYSLNGINYEMARHGFARNYDFTVLNKTENSISFVLTDNEETLLQYPFNFQLTITYTIHIKGLTIDYTVKNNSKDLMPFSIGAHPAISIDSEFKNYSIQFENDSELISHELENENFSGKTNPIKLEEKTLKLNYDLFEKDAIVVKEFQSNYLTIYKHNSPFIRISFDNFPHLGIWTKKDAQFLCIEPWQGYADNENTTGDLIKKEGMLHLLPNEEKNFSISFEIQ
ncbi:MULTISPECIES: aldose 1-epimerase family protein [Flavobacterium]|uniref:Aldose 1-epimerase family protein n=1 Tax=Flavobacterium hankyongi TaxID=1176532 RepID=A0ABP8ZWY1_9FLAO|nr:aldose 1-epimerase family protein [Flavobacterium sp. N1846]